MLSSIGFVLCVGCLAAAILGSGVFAAVLGGLALGWEILLTVPNA